MTKLYDTPDLSDQELMDLGKSVFQIYKTARGLRVAAYNSFGSHGSGFNGIVELAQAYADAEDQCQKHNAYFDTPLLSNMYGRLLAVTLWHAAHQGLNLETLMTYAFANSAQIADVPCECTRCASD